jgi:CelD/BcsL family acetyltransferase involved in cellulose biosynthesis
MVQFEPVEYSRESWLEIAATMPGYNLMQDWSYGEAKADCGGWQVERGLFQEAGTVVGVAQVLLRTIPVIGSGLAWLNRGPLSRPGTENGTLLKTLHGYYCDERGFYLRIAPQMPAENLAPTSLPAMGFRQTTASGWASARLDLTPDLATLRSGLRQKWRNALNKAERAGIHIDSGADGELFERFLDEYQRFLEDRGIETSVTPELLRALQRNLPPHSKLRSYQATLAGEALGSVLVVKYGPTIEYLAGTSLDAGRPYSVGQLLLWRAIADAKEADAQFFDLGGMDPDITPKGIFEFKRGVGGESYRLATEIEGIQQGWRPAFVRWAVERRHRIQ